MTWRTAAAVAGFLCLGLCASGLAGGAPEAWRALAAMLGVLVIPALIITGAVGGVVRAGGAGTGLVIAASLFLWLSLLAIWTECFNRFGAGFASYAGVTTWALLALYAAIALRGARSAQRIRSGAAPAPSVRGWWIGLGACALLALLAPPTLTPAEDALDHIGHIRRILASDRMRPDGILAWPVDAAAALAPDPRKGALHPVLALLASVGGVDPAVVWRWLGVVMVPAGMVAFVAFSASFIRSTWGRILCVALFVLSYDGSVLRFANASASGEAVAAGWCWVVVALGVHLGRSGASGGGLAVLTALVVGGVLAHLGVAVHASVLAATVVLLGSWLGMDRRGRLRVGAAVLLAAGAGLAVRVAGGTETANVIHRHVQGVLYVGDGWFVASPMEILRLHGLVFLGGLVLAPALMLAARKRSDARAIVAMAAVPFVMSFVPWVATPLFEHGSYMVFRSLLGVPAYPAIVITLAWYAAARARTRAALVVGAPALIVWSLVFLRPVPEAVMADVRHRIERAHDAPLVSNELAHAVAALPAGRTILSDPASAYVLSAFTTHRVVAVYQQHGNPLDPYALDRLRAVRDVLSPFGEPDVAVADCARYQVDYLVVNSGRDGDASDFLSVWSPDQYDTALRRLNSMSGSFVLVDSIGGGCIYRFDPAARLNRSWSMPGRPVVTGAPLLDPCALDAPDNMFRVTGVSVVPEQALPGDTLAVTLGYRRDGPSPFALPVLIHLRFDHDVLGRGARYPGEKIVRRAADRREAAFTRFRADVRPGHGLYAPDLWPIGIDLCERFTVVVPANARLGGYRVEVGIARDSLLPNFHAADLFYNRDHYSGTACARLTVARHVTGGGAPR